ncbi:hypothetical protein ACP4OV_018241 [Aristida adscensionis]
MEPVPSAMGDEDERCEDGGGATAAGNQDLHRTPNWPQPTWEDKAATVFNLLGFHNFSTKSCDSSSSNFCLDFDEHCRVDSPVAQHTTSRGDLCSMEVITHGDLVHGEELVSNLKWWRVDDRDQRLLMVEELTWEEKVVSILHMARCREITEYNRKLRCHLPTRFCDFNIAFFDHDKESTYVTRPPVHSIPPPCNDHLDDSVNIIGIKIVESDRGYPISIFGSVLARDEYDYRCVCLFKRGRDNPQIIASKDETLTLTGPSRALAASDSMYFEFNLKIKSDEAVDEDFSKGYIEHNAIHHTEQPMIQVLESCLSTLELVYTPVPCAVEASVSLSFLKGLSDRFIGHVRVWTTENDENEIFLYDSDAAGTQTRLASDGSVALTRNLVAVPLDEDLVLHVCVFEDENDTDPDACLELIMGHKVEEYTVEEGSYQLQVKVSWGALDIQQRHPGMWKDIGGVRMLV